MPAYGLLPADQGSGLKPWSYAEERLQRARNFWISTTRPDGRPHAVPIWALWLQDQLLFSTSERSSKARNLSALPYAVIGSEPADDAIVLEGPVERVRDSALIRAFVQAYAAKYAEKMDDFSEPVYVLRPKLAFAFSTTDFTGSATRWTFA
jgi:pyridoxine/pyridoxamine 5'-phosphate oxidase